VTEEWTDSQTQGHSVIRSTAWRRAVKIAPNAPVDRRRVVNVNSWMSSYVAVIPPTYVDVVLTVGRTLIRVCGD